MTLPSRERFCPPVGHSSRFHLLTVLFIVVRITRRAFSGRSSSARPRSMSRNVISSRPTRALPRAGRSRGLSDLLDAHGGTDLVQVAPACVAFDHGAEQIVGLRLAPKGMHRWYAACCNTPTSRAAHRAQGRRARRDQRSAHRARERAVGRRARRQGKPRGAAGPHLLMRRMSLDFPNSRLAAALTWCLSLAFLRRRGAGYERDLRQSTRLCPAFSSGAA